MKIIQHIMIICALISSQAQSAVKIEDPMIDKHLKGLVQTHTLLSKFFCSVVERVSCKGPQESWAVDVFESALSEFDKDVQIIKRAAPDAAQGFNLDLRSKAWGDLRDQQREHLTYLIENLAKQSYPRAISIARLQCYLQSVERLESDFETLWAHLSFAKEKRASLGPHLKGFVQTHDALSVFVSAVVDHVSCSQSKQAIRAAKQFQYLCTRALSAFKMAADTAHSDARYYWDVHAEEENDSQKYKYDAPDDVSGFIVTPHIQEWERLEKQQLEHVAGLIDVFKIRFPYNQCGCESAVSCLRYYNLSFVKIGAYLKSLSVYLERVKDRSDILLHINGFVTTHGALSNFLPVVVDRVWSSSHHNNLATPVARMFEQSCNQALCCLEEKFENLHWLLVNRYPQYGDVHEEKTSDPQEYSNVAPDDERVFNFTAYFQGFDDLRKQPEQHIERLIELWGKRGDNVSSDCIQMCISYLECCNEMRHSFQKCSEDLVLAKKESDRMAFQKCLADLALTKEESDRMAVVWQDFLKTHKDCKDFGWRVIRCLDPEHIRTSQEVYDWLKSLKESLQDLESTALALQVQSFGKNLTVYKEEKGEFQEHKVIPHDDRCVLEVCVSKYQNVGKCQNINLEKLLELMQSPLVDACELGRQWCDLIVGYQVCLADTQWSLSELVRKLAR